MKSRKAVYAYIRVLRAIIWGYCLLYEAPSYPCKAQNPLRNGFTAYNVLSPENGSFASVAPRETIASGCIDASTATSGPHVFAVRSSRARLSQLSRPPHPRPSLRRWPTPSEWDGMAMDMHQFALLEKRNIFYFGA